MIYNNAENRRIEWIDTAKGIGICLVVIGHIPGMDESILNLIYSFHMPFFFIITGMLISNKPQKEKFRGYLEKQVVKLLRPYYVASMINILFLAIRYRDLIHVPMRIVEMLSFNGYSALWFIPTLFFAKLFFFMLYYGIYEKRKWGGILAFSLCLFVTWFYSAWDMRCLFVDRDDYGWILKYVATIPNTIVRSLLGMIYIVIGVFVGRLWKKVEEKKKDKFICFVFSIVAICAIVLSVNYDNRIDFIICRYKLSGLFLSITISLFVIMVCYIEKNRFKSNILSLWGENSMIILVTHLSMEIVFFFDNLLSNYMRGAELLVGVFVCIMLIETLIIFFLRVILRYYKRVYATSTK